jgi:pimeloyl-ACP methyl ester carboxylesterase
MVLLRDSFDRADSPQLGLPWGEAGEVSAEFINGAGYYVGPARTEVSQGTLSFIYVNHSQKPQFPFLSVNGRPVAYAPLARGVSARPAVFSFTFEPHPDNRVSHEAGLMSLAGGFRESVAHSGVTNYTPLNGFGVSFGRSSTAFNNSQVSIIKYEGGVRTVLAEKPRSFQFASGQTYTISLTIAPDFSATAQISDGISTDEVTSPATAVSFPLDQFFIADVEGGISSDTRGAGDYLLRFDDVLVQEIGPTPRQPQRPLIFIPGIAGSRLDGREGTKIWPPPSKVDFVNPFSSAVYTRLSLDPSLPPSAPPSDIIVPDVIRLYEEASRPEERDVYSSILMTLTDPNAGGYHEYDVDEKPERRTYEGCDLRQQPNNPTLFVFAYDWRKGNREAAEALHEYVRCVQRFYPGTEVDIVAHSQGGLLARRYILDHPGDHDVNKLITVASPWLGAPKAINVLETGRFLDPSSVLKDAVRNQIFKTLSEYYPGVHELVPSQSYFDAGGAPPYGYLGQLLTYPQVATLLDQQFPVSKPGAANSAFHGIAGQDDWSQDQSGVEYHHIYGLKRTADTVGRVVPREDILLGSDSDARKHTIFDIVLTNGDGTVPIISARRTPALNAPGVSVMSGRIKAFTWASSCDGQSHPVDHTGLMRNPCVIAEILSRLQTSPSLQTREATNAGTLAAEPEEPEARPAHYLRVIGAASAAVQDAQGNTNNLLGDPADNNVPNVTSYLLGEQAFLTIIPLGQAYTVTLQAGDGPMRVELTQGNDVVTSQVTRYQDLILPAGALANIQITPQGADVLRYDGDGDGTFETSVTPTAVVTGAAAQDNDPPAITFSQNLEPIGVSVSLAATDGGTGVKTIYYSTDGTNFQTYSEPVTFDSAGIHVVYAFAEDNAANRSGLSRYKFVVLQRLPRKLGHSLARAVASRKRP